MSDLNFADTWSSRLTSLLGDTWYQARREILLASRMEMDDSVWMTSSPDHMGDPAKKVDQLVHQAASDGLRGLVPGVQVLGEEATLANLALRTRDFRYIAYLDAIDGSAQAWSLPGAWGHVMIVQEFLGGGQPDSPTCEIRFVAVLDAEGGVTMAEPALPYVAVTILDRLEQDAYGDDNSLSYDSEGGRFEVTKLPAVLVGGYKPSWWPPFSALRVRIRDRWAPQKVPVFNTAGAPVVRKLIQNADNVAVQLTPSSLWDGAAAALVARAGGRIIRIGDQEPVDNEEVWSWWSRFGYEMSQKPGEEGRWAPSLCVPPFVAGMNPERVQEVAALCRNLPAPD